MAHFQTSTENEDNIYETINPTLKEENIYSEIEHANIPSDATEKGNSQAPSGYTEVGFKLSPAMDPQADHSKSDTQLPHYVVMKGTVALQARSRHNSEHRHSTMPKKTPPPTYPKTKRSNSVSYSSFMQPPGIRYERAFSSSVNLAEICGIQLSEFVATNRQSLPQRVEIVKGVHGLNDKPTPLACDMLNIHQVIERDVVKVEDPLSQQSFPFPINSIVKFSPVYHSDDHSISTLDDTCFSIAELLTLKPLPKVVCVLTGYNSEVLNLNLETNDILVVKGIVKSDSPQGPSTLQAYSTHAKHEKSLVESNMIVRLSITPEHLRMSLSEITEHVLSRPLPVMLFSDSVSASKIPKHLFSRVLHLREVITEVLLLATYAHVQPGLKDKLLSIPIDLDIRVCVIGLGKDEMAYLKSETASIVASKHTSMQTVHLNASTDTQTSQEEIYAAVRPQKFRPHISSDSPIIYDDATSIRSTLIQSHMNSSQNTKLKDRKQEDIVYDEDTISGERFGDDMAAIELLGLEEQIQREISRRTNQSQPNIGSGDSSGDCTSVEQEPTDIKRVVPDGTTIPKPTESKLTKKPPLPPKPLGLKPSTGQPRKKILTVRNNDIQGQPSLPRADGRIETKSLEGSYVTELPPRAEQKDSVRVGVVVDAQDLELEDKKAGQSNKPPPVPPKPMHIQLRTDQTTISETDKLSEVTPTIGQKPRKYSRRPTESFGEAPASTQPLSSEFPSSSPKSNEQMQTDHSALNEIDQFPEISTKAIQKPSRYFTELGEAPASTQLSQTPSSEFSPKSKVHEQMQTDQTALNKTHELPEVSPEVIQKPIRYSTEASTSTKLPQTRSSKYSPSSPKSTEHEQIQTNQTTDEASASTQMSSQFSPSLVDHNAQGKSNQDSRGRQQLYTTSSRAETSSLGSSVMTFPEFVAHYAESFPIRIRVQEGLYEVRQGFSSANTYPLSTNDVYNIHFLKETKVVTFSDQDGHMYTAPLNSSVQFCPLYNPEGNLSRATQGYRFDTVKDILTVAELPKVICATRPYTGPNPKSSVIEHEVLAIRKASKTALRKKPVLKVYSITTNEEKILHEDCQGHFSTAPQLVRLHLPEIILCIPNPFPLRSIMTIDLVESEYSEPLPAYLTSNTVTLFHESVELSVIATTHWKNGRAPPKADQIPFEIPTTMDFPLSIEYPSSSRDRKTLTSTTQQIYDHFDPTRVRLCSASNAIPQRISIAREVLYQSIRTGHENEGIVLKKPSFGNPIYYSREVCSGWRLPSLASSGNESNSNNEASDDASCIEVPRMLDLESSTNKYQGRLIVVAQQQTHDSDKIKQRKESKGQEQIGNLDRKRTGQTSTEVSTTSPLLSPGPPLELMRTALELSSSLTEEEQNIAFLRTLNKQQILKLLDAMKLPQYKATFEQEQVDGVILTKCSETILESELNITKELHRVRIMQVIAGIHSAESILEEANSGYVGFSHSPYT